MKGERRHELQTNELADMLAHGLDRYRGQLPNILWGAIAVLAVLVAVMTWNSRHRSSQTVAWEEFDQVQYVDMKLRPKRLKEVAAHYPDSDIALWAQLDLADQLCFDGREKMQLDREVATTYLKEAQQTYAAVLQNPKARVEMIRRAAFAEPKCWELLGDREKAIESYKMVAAKVKSTLPEVASQAETHAAELARPEAADFYRWLAEHKPAGPPLNMPGLGFPPIDLGPDKDKSDLPPTGAGPAKTTEESSSKEPAERDAASDPSPSPDSPNKADPPDKPPEQN